MSALDGELRQAQEARNAAKIQELMIEAESIEQALSQAEAKAMALDDIAGQVSAYRTDVVTAMKQIEPRTEQLFERLGSLAQLIQASSPT